MSGSRQPATTTDPRPAPPPPRHPDSAPRKRPESGEIDLKAAAQGDKAAWESLVTAYSGRVFGLLARKCGDRDLAEELTQATFVRLVDKLTDFAGYKEQGRFEPWLFRVATNLLRDEQRRRHRQAGAIDTSPSAGVGGSGQDASAWAQAEAGMAQQRHADPVDSTDPLAQLDRAEQVQKLRDAVASLPEADRELLELRHTAGLSFPQIAETLGQPLGTVLARGHRALGKLRKMLTDQTDDT